MILETERLLLREMKQDDLPALQGILQDEETMYAYNGAFDEAETQAWLDRQLSRYAQYGFGLWAVVLKESGGMIGQCGLTMQPWRGDEVLEVGYLFNRAFWHHGYATEAARGCMEYAFDLLGAREVCSIIRETNLPSRRVAERNGMTVRDTWVKHYRGIDMPHVRYCAVREKAKTGKPPKVMRPSEAFSIHPASPGQSAHSGRWRPSSVICVRRACPADMRPGPL